MLWRMFAVDFHKMFGEHGRIEPHASEVSSIHSFSIVFFTTGEEAGNSN